MAALELLRPDHAPAVLAFERENRRFFAASVPDRGDAYFAAFDERHRSLLEEQAAGDCFFHVLVDPAVPGEILGRVNLVDVADGSADLGYRVGERSTGRGLATRAVREVSARARSTYGLSSLRARTTQDNVASRTVLERAGFVVQGSMLLDGAPGLRYLCDLTG